jgi:hypothetical protein
LFSKTFPVSPRLVKAGPLFSLTFPHCSFDFQRDLFFLFLSAATSCPEEVKESVALPVPADALSKFFPDS